MEVVCCEVNFEGWTLKSTHGHVSQIAESCSATGIHDKQKFID